LRKKIVITGLMLLAGFIPRAVAQDGLNYTQYMNNLVPLNQAYSMLDKSGSVNAMVRKQYAGLNGAPGSVFFNGQLPVPAIGAAAGVLVVNDKFAIEQSLEASAFFAKEIQLDAGSYLSVSLNAGFKRYVANYSTLDPTDPSFREDIRETRPTLGFGVLYYTARYYLGLSMPRLAIRSLGNASRESDMDFKNHYYFSGAYLYALSPDLQLKPAVTAKYARGLPFTADISATLYLNGLIGIGGNYRTNQQIAGILSVNTNSFRLGYSYQVASTKTNLIGFSNAIHEVNLGFRFGKDIKPKLL